MTKDWNDWLRSAYPEDTIPEILAGIAHLQQKYAGQKAPSFQLSEKDVLLITYGDQLSRPGERPLQSLRKFMQEVVKGSINSVHILPFYPYSSDDGFSVIDYYQVNPELGLWEDIAALRESFHLMFDAVINHISQESDWFKGFLAGEEKYANYFIEDDPQKDFSKVVRPRVHPLLHDFVDTQGRSRYLWTTFSRDQVDLNFKNPKVLLHILDLLLFYVSHGAQLIRLDAIGFMWKEDDSTCMHLPQTHHLIKLMRSVVAEVFPDTIFITETNVPHQENISYFGNGYDEAQLVYNFTLPPLLAYSILTGNAEKFNAWAASLELPSKEVCFFNFTASHDGIGVRPVQGILSDTELQVLVDAATANQGLVSYKTNSDGSQSPYEINCNYFSLLKGVTGKEAMAIKRMIASQAILLAFPGVPAIYFHSLVGSQNDVAGVAQTGIKRSINREKLDYEQLLDELQQAGTARNIIFQQIQELLRVRNGHPCFHPFSDFSIPDFGKSFIAIERVAPSQDRKLLLLFNISAQKQSCQLPSGPYQDLLQGRLVEGTLELEPYEFAWLD